MDRKTLSLDLKLYEYGELVSGFSVNASDEDRLSHKAGCTACDAPMLLTHVKEGYRLTYLKPDVKRIYIEVTTRCNFDCITCIRSSWKCEQGYMEMETFNKLLEGLRNLPELESVHFGGFGEPMMHPHIFEMLDAVKKLGVRVEMISNGSYLSAENAEKLIDIGLDILFTSIDSPEETAYSAIRIGAELGNITGNISTLQKIKAERGASKPELGIEFVAMKKNFRQLPALIELAHGLKASQIIVSNLIPYHASMKDEIVYDMEDTGTMFGMDSLKATIWAQISNMKLRTERTCRFVENKSLCVNADGNISPCYALMHEYDCYVYDLKKHVYPCYVGNVNDDDLAENWMQRGYVNFRNAVTENRFPSCTDCKSRDGCTYTDSNEMDCWGNSPSCGDCLWARRIIACP